MKKWAISGIIVLILIAIGISFAVSRHQKPQPLTLITVKRGDITQTATAAGNVLPKETITVKSQVAGTAEKITADAGEQVKRGQLLVHIKQTKSPDQITQLISDVNTAQAKLTDAKQQLDNYKLLLDNGLIKPNYSQYSTAQSAYNNALTDYQVKKQNLDLFQTGQANINGQLITSDVTSPVDGYILQRLVNVGDSINSISDNQAATPLFTIADMNKLVFQGDVDERYANSVKVGEPATVTIAALPNTPIHGTITSVALQSDQQNNKSDANSGAKSSSSSSADSDNSPFNVGFQIEIGKLEIPKNVRLLSGYSANATVNLATEKNVLLIPERALLFKNGKTCVELYDGANKPPKITPVTLGLSDESKVVVTSGLKEGDQIVDISAVPTPSGQ